ncbi:nucleotide-binding universal stress UspA family protein [Brevibacterium sanguinis]|uniref:Nucleotide-binding universal stress UspA family protein n=2 Tax=Brevibacterium TaxID=1696 RepID=A0A366IHG4_9MICO|nr:MULTISPECIES: universal stress protein [Brevibacterium]RBP64998.1 nucleotide-binding universal stress UspA family protein [Brevibacterium sanguinis]RBP71261.1 nucleotide-binding universal stress UspA family protein [Brevibacterium celere]
MSIVVGIAPGQDNRAALELGIVLARSYSQDLDLASINSAAWPPGRISVGADYQAHIRRLARESLDEARSLVPDDVVVATHVHDAVSSRRGLLEMCERLEALRLVVGPAADGPADRVHLGSVSSGLLHSAELPVALAPEGFTAEAGARLQRITAAYSGSSTSAELILGAAVVAAEAGVPLRIASFAPRSRVLSAAGIGLEVEAKLIDEWKATIREDIAEILSEIEQLPARPESVDVEVGTGASWGQALGGVSWDEPEVMMLGSSGLGVLKRVALGSHAVKILQNSPVPVVVVPRRAKEDYSAGVLGPGRG